jgi:predicted DNA-binding transcriptional regulator AlpA
VTEQVSEVDELLTFAEVAALTKVPEKTLRNWRSAGDKSPERGPAGFKLGNHVRFRRSEVLRWLAEREVARGA